MIVKELFFRLIPGIRDHKIVFNEAKCPIFKSYQKNIIVLVYLINKTGQDKGRKGSKHVCVCVCI